MYWDINNAITILYDNDDTDIVDEAIERLQWCLATLNEELLELESQ